jgi:outer membrane protein assembly factor BamE (lipoprotein component of BamABCDE complex)
VMFWFEKIVKCLGLALVSLGVFGCVSTHEQSGMVLPRSTLKQIQVGKTTQQDVFRLLGTPSSVSAIDPNTWYYASCFSETCAFLDPTILESRLYVLTFSPGGILAKMDEKSKQEMETIAMVKRVTPPVGQSTPVMKQLFRNLGKAPVKGKRP